LRRHRLDLLVLNVSSLILFPGGPSLSLFLFSFAGRIPEHQGVVTSLLQLRWAGLDLARSNPMRAARDPEHRPLTKTGAYNGSAVVCSTSENGIAASLRQATGEPSVEEAGGFHKIVGS
jgi:hypothetical protein